jgi:hypothetical protein
MFHHHEGQGGERTETQGSELEQVVRPATDELADTSMGDIDEWNDEDRVNYEKGGDADDDDGNSSPSRLNSLIHALEIHRTRCGASDIAGQEDDAHGEERAELGHALQAVPASKVQVPE